MNNNVIEPAAVQGAGIPQVGDIATTEKPYTFRKLNSTDMFLMFKILGKIGIKQMRESFGEDNVNKLVAAISAKGDTAQNVLMDIGLMLSFDLVDIVLNNLPRCEEEIQQMLANVSGLKVKQIREMDIATFTEMVVDFIRKEDFKDFFKVVSKLFSK